MTKQEFIHNKWLETIGKNKFALISWSIDDNGFCPTHQLRANNIKTSKMKVGKFNARPISLQGVEHNFGWHKVDEIGHLPGKDFSDTPKQYRAGLLKNGVFEEMPHGFTSELLVKLFECGKMTHYQPIEKKLPPLF